MELKNVYTYSNSKNNVCYKGTLRNERRFNIGDLVFFARSKFGTRELIRGRICGVVEDWESDNVTYKYTVSVVMDYQTAFHFHEPDSNKVVENLDCSTIFWTIQEAKQSALDAAFNAYERQLEEIEILFSSWEKYNEKDFKDIPKANKLHA